MLDWRGEPATRAIALADLERIARAWSEPASG